MVTPAASVKDFENEIRYQFMIILQVIGTIKENDFERSPKPCQVLSALYGVYSQQAVWKSSGKKRKLTAKPSPAPAATVQRMALPGMDESRRGWLEAHVFNDIQGSALPEQGFFIPRQSKMP